MSTATTSSSTGSSHEQVIIRRGPRSGVTMIAAVHSTRLGPAVGGTRMWNYPHWRAALDDALRLSEAMTYKNSAAGLDHGGGKAVVALPPGVVLAPQQREAAMLDLGDVIQGLQGSFLVGEDVGVTGADMVVVRRRTAWVGGLPEQDGGSGEPAEPTAIGVYAALRTTARHAFGTDVLHGRRACVIGLGQVGQRLARRLAGDGAVLTVTDVDPAKRALADELGARWVEPDQALFEPTELLVPAALGGFLNEDTVPQLRCTAIVGPANNQLVDETIADLLSDRGILWAPDFIVNAGGVSFSVSVGLHGASAAEALTRVEGIGDSLDVVLTQAHRTGRSTLSVAMDTARRRIDSASPSEPTSAESSHARG